METSTFLGHMVGGQETPVINLKKGGSDWIKRKKKKSLRITNHWRNILRGFQYSAEEIPEQTDLN